MAQIGGFGEVVFSTSDQRILNFDNMKQSVSGQWSKHKLIGRKPKGEFNGADLRKVTFSMLLDVNLGVRPRKMLELLENMVENGFVDYLVIGNRAIGNNRFCITGISETWDTVYNGGELAQATVNVTMEEYV